LVRHHAKLQKLIGDIQRVWEMADLRDRIRAAEQQLTLTREQILAANQLIVDERDVAAALSEFGPVWETISPREQARIIRLLIERVDYDGDAGTVSLTFRPSGIQALSQEQAREEAA
jgi:site-specific DNA recombinase